MIKLLRIELRMITLLILTWSQAISDKRKQIRVNPNLIEGYRAAILMIEAGFAETSFTFQTQTKPKMMTDYIKWNSLYQNMFLPVSQEAV